MVEHGGLLTEYHSQVEMHPSFFPQRNRIVAGMCDAIVVIESAVKGGALITANIANSKTRACAKVSTGSSCDDNYPLNDCAFILRCKLNQDMTKCIAGTTPYQIVRNPSDCK